MFTERVWSGVTIVVILCSMCAFVSSWYMPKPANVLLPVPSDRLDDVQWLGDPSSAKTTCGEFKAYRSDVVEKMAGRWYTVYTTNFPTKTDYCSHFTNVQQPCKCLGIDFTTNLQDEVVMFDLFSTNTVERSVTYEMATAQMNGKTQLNMYQIILRGFVMQSNTRISGKGGFIIPNGVLIDTDDFSSYMVLLFCLEKAQKPIIMVLANALPPMLSTSRSSAMSYLNDNNLDTANLFEVDHSNCKYGQNLVGYSNN